MEPEQENYLTEEIRQRLRVLLKQSKPNYTWKKLNGFSDDELTGLSVEMLDKQDKKREKERSFILSLPERIEVLYPDIKKMYPDIDLSSLPEKDLERIVSGEPIFEVLGRFSTIPKYLAEQLEETERTKTKRWNFSKYKEGRTQSTSVKFENRGTSDRNYYG
jgi:hypothetical protein